MILLRGALLLSSVGTLLTSAGVWLWRHYDT